MVVRARWLGVVLALAGCKHGGGHAHDTAHHRFDDAEAWAKRFDSPERDAWQRPDAVLSALALPPGAKVADVGSATGYFAVRLARTLPQGRVYGLDIESSMVDFLNARAEKEELANLSSHLAALDDPKIPEPVDLVLLVNTYHHVEARLAYFAKLAASVRPGGRLAIIDFTRASKMGPPAEHKVPPEQVREELAAAGWALAASHDVLPEQFFLVFSREASNAVTARQ